MSDALPSPGKLKNQVHEKTGVKVIVVGAGFGGLATAIECFRKGHDVVVFEQAPELAMLGECFYSLNSVS